MAENLTAALQLYSELQFRKVAYNLNGFTISRGLLIDNDYNFFNPKDPQYPVIPEIAGTHMHLTA